MQLILTEKYEKILVPFFNMNKSLDAMEAAAGHPQIRLHAIDGLRGTAALMVAVCHFQTFFSPHPFLDSGWIAVSLFFLLSGIVMSHVYEQKILQQKVKLSEFLAHRIARLWPLHVFAMLTVLVVELGHGYLSPRQDALNWDSAVYTFFLNLTLLQNAGLFFGRDGGATWDGNGWSLTPEVVLNLLWFYWLAKRRLSSGLLVVVVLVCAVVQFNFGGQLNGTILSSRIVAATIPYGIGCLVYRHFLQREAWQILSPRLWNVLGVFTFLLAVAALAGGGGGHKSSVYFLWHNWDWLLVLFVFPALTVIALIEGTLLNRFFSSPPLAFLGYISYSVYLMQYQVAKPLGLLRPWFTAHAILPWLGVIFLVTLCTVSYFIYWWVETPTRKFLRRPLEALFARVCD